MKKKRVGYIVYAAMIAAIYVVLVLVFNYWSFGFIQFRVAEALTILPYFTAAAVPGLTIGCFLANILCGAALPDIIFGTVATLLGAVGTRLLKKCKWLAPLPPVVANTLIIPWVLKIGYGVKEAVLYMMFTIGVSEIVVCYILGMMLLLALQKNSSRIFGG